MRVLIAIDNSKFASEVTDTISQHPWPEHTEFMILNVVEACTLPYSTDDFLRQCRILLETTVANLSRKLPDHKVTGEVIEGEAKQEIVTAAEQWKADLIIIGAHGETGLKRHGIGNVVMSVLNHAPCSVEVVKPRHSVQGKERATKKESVRAKT